MYLCCRYVNLYVYCIYTYNTYIQLYTTQIHMYTCVYAGYVYITYTIYIYIYETYKCISVKEILNNCLNI